MYQNIYGAGGGGQAGSFPQQFASGTPYGAAMGFQPGLLFGQQYPGLGMMLPLGHMLAVGQVPSFTPQGYQGYPQAYPQAYPRTPGPPLPPPSKETAQHGEIAQHLRQNPHPEAPQHREHGGEASRDQHRRRPFTEAPCAKYGESKRQAIADGQQNVPGRSSRFNNGCQQRNDTASQTHQYQHHGAPGEQRGNGRVEGGTGNLDGPRDDGSSSRDVPQGSKYNHQVQSQHVVYNGSRVWQQRGHLQQAGTLAGTSRDGGQDVGQNVSSASAEAVRKALTGTETAAGASGVYVAAATAGVAAASRGALATAGGGDGGRPSRISQRLIYKVLSRNIRQMVDALSPTLREMTDKEMVLDGVRQAAQAAFPEYQGIIRVEPFGSYMCGLETKSSDIDVVVVGLAEPSPSLGFYSKSERPRVARLLDRLTPHLRSRLHVSKLIPVRHARVPILKITTADGVSVDISIAGMSGPKAAEFIRQQVSSYPALRPLVLVLKSYMREIDLGEVSKGGLSSYGLTYMVLAHLKEELRRGTDTSDLGGLLHSLLRRYGRTFVMATMAVSVAHGGLVPRAQLGCVNADHVDRIVTIDPLTGHNITEGTFRSSEVLSAFAQADTYLSDWASRRDEDIPLDADILLPLVSTVPDDDEYVQEYAPPANGSQLGKRGRSQDLGY